MRVAIMTKGASAVFENDALLRAFRERNVEAALYHPERFSFSIGNRSLVTYRNEPFPLPDALLSRTGSGTGGQADAVMRRLQDAGVTVINPPPAIQASKNKIETLLIAEVAGLSIPQTIVHGQLQGPAAWNGKFPCIVKVATGSHGAGVVLCLDEAQLKAVLDLIRILDRRRSVLIQEYIADRPGQDLRVLIVGKAVGAMLRSSTDGDFRAGYSTGGVGQRFKLEPDMTRIAESIAGRLALEVCGIDLLFNRASYTLTEANSAPGFEAFTKYCGVDVAGKIADYVVQRIVSLR